jgi:hypothetical protein
MSSNDPRDIGPRIPQPGDELYLVPDPRVAAALEALAARQAEQRRAEANTLAAAWRDLELAVAELFRPVRERLERAAEELSRRLERARRR